jgi:hypothetical protein
MAKSILDRATGEVLTEPDFVKVYIANLCDVKGLNSAQQRMFNFMLLNMNWKNIVSFGPQTKRDFLEESGMKNQTFNNNVSSLIKCQLIERVCRGEFRVNKKYAVKVDWAKVQEIVWTTTYTAAGKKETVNFKG